MIGTHLYDHFCRAIGAIGNITTITLECFFDHMKMLLHYISSQVTEWVENKDKVSMDLFD